MNTFFKFTSPTGKGILVQTKDISSVHELEDGGCTIFLREDTESFEVKNSFEEVVSMINQ